MTQTLDMHDALGVGKPAPRTSDVVTADFDSVFSQFDVAHSERTMVRNVVVRTTGGGAHALRARAAIDAVQRSLIKLAVIEAGESDREDLAFISRLLERLTTLAPLARGPASAGMAASDEVAGLPSEVPPIDGAALEAAHRIALSVFPEGSMIHWSDDEDEDGSPLKLMTVESSAPAGVIHAAYLEFMRAWVRAEPSDRRRRIRVSWRVGALG